MGNLYYHYQLFILIDYFYFFIFYVTCIFRLFFTLFHLQFKSNLPKSIYIQYYHPIQIIINIHYNHKKSRLKHPTLPPLPTQYLKLPQIPILSIHVSLNLNIHKMMITIESKPIFNFRCSFQKYFEPFPSIIWIIIIIKCCYFLY